jgi:hypothetical protein
VVAREVKVGRADLLRAVKTEATEAQVGTAQIVPVRKVGQGTEGKEEELVMELAVAEEAMVGRAGRVAMVEQYNIAGPGTVVFLA